MFLSFSFGSIVCHASVIENVANYQILNPSDETTIQLKGNNQTEANKLCKEYKAIVVVPLPIRNAIITPAKINNSVVIDPCHDDSKKFTNNSNKNITLTIPPPSFKWSIPKQ